jgi:hypothetical protein
MNESFRRLYREICGEPQISYDRLQQVYRELKTIGDFRHDLLDAMGEQLERQNWGCLHRLIFAVHVCPDKIFTSLLCQLLDHQKEHGFSESAADALIDIGDERSVPSLISSLDYYEPGDDDRNFNKKILHALAGIKTEAAMGGLRAALDNPDEQIREAAALELARLRDS